MLGISVYCLIHKIIKFRHTIFIISFPVQQVELSLPVTSTSIYVVYCMHSLIVVAVSWMVRETWNVLNHTIYYILLCTYTHTQTIGSRTQFIFYLNNKKRHQIIIIIISLSLSKIGKLHTNASQTQPYLTIISIMEVQ